MPSGIKSQGHGTFLGNTFHEQLESDRHLCPLTSVYCSLIKQGEEDSNRQQNRHRGEKNIHRKIQILGLYTNRRGSTNVSVCLQNTGLQRCPSRRVKWISDCLFVYLFSCLHERSCSIMKKTVSKKYRTDHPQLGLQQSPEPEIDEERLV